MPQSLNYRGVIGKGILVRLIVGFLQERGTEGLRCLHQTISITVHRFATLGKQVTHCFHNRNHRYNSTISLGILIATIDDLVRHEGAHTVVHGHQSIGLIDQSQAIPYGMKARGATIGYAVGHTEAILAT